MSGQSLKQLLFDIDNQEFQRMKDLKLDEQKLETAQGHMAAMKFLAQQEKNTKFQNKRYQELEKLVNSPHHTRANIRIKFADGYIL